MSKTEADEKTKARWAFGNLWKKLHFGHISKNDRVQNALQASYKFGLEPFRKYTLNAISARINRKKLMTFQFEIPPPKDRPVRVKLTPKACVLVTKNSGVVRQVIKDWPEEVEVLPNTKIYDEDSDEYITIEEVFPLEDTAVAIKVNRDLVGSRNLILKGRPIRVIAESVTHKLESIRMNGIEYPILESITSVSGERNELLVPLHHTEIDKNDIDHLEIISVNKWKPKSSTQLLDGSRVSIESWTGRTDITINRNPENPEFITSEGVRVSWSLIEQDGVWVKPSASVTSDAVIDPIDILFENTDIRQLDVSSGEDSKGIQKTFSILERNRNSQMIRLSGKPVGEALVMPVQISDLLNQKNAIERLQQAPLSHHIPLMELTTRLDHDYIEAWSDFEPQDAPNVEWLTRVGSGADGSFEQRRFILKALASKDFAFLEGPPGSGKTETIGELILQLLSDNERNYRILLCGSTQASIDNVLSRFGDHDLVQPLRIVNSKRWRNEPDDRDQLVYDSDIHRWTEPEQVDDLRQRLGNAASDLSNNDLAEMILRRSNLVCATIGGVAQHPQIKDALRNQQVPPKALFDVLIIDEASKTTFTEFLIPAIFCKKWVLVGDVAQLPPFTNQEDIAGMLDLLETNDEDITGSSLRKACLNIRKAIDDVATFPHHLKKIPRLLVEKSETVLAMQREWFSRILRSDSSCEDDQLRNIQVAFIGPLVENGLQEGIVCINTSDLKINDWKEIGRNRLMLMNCNLIVIAQSCAGKFADLMLPTSHLTPEMMSKEISIPSDEILPDRFRYRLKMEKDRLQDRYKGEEYRRNPFRMNRGLNGETTTWGKQIAWRIQRVYEMQTSENVGLRDIYLNQARSLLPSATNAEEWANEVEKIRCFSLPSILESLQHGFTGRKGKASAPQELAPKVPTTLSEGFPKRAKNARFESIRHQHRMHWSISKFPRKEFYGTEGGENQQRLLDANQTLEARSDFGFLLNQSNLNLNAQERRYWVDVSNGVEIAIIGNPQEAEKVSEILDDLIHWFEKEGTERDSLSVALLTPYVNQSRTIRTEANTVLQKRKTSIKGTRCNIKLNDNRTVTIFCSTVDKFQGQEADVVILSLRNVRRQGNIDSPNRANVALTRAREVLFIVGNRTNYKNARDPMLKRLATGIEAADETTYWRTKK